MPLGRALNPRRNPRRTRSQAVLVRSIANMRCPQEELAVRRVETARDIQGASDAVCRMYFCVRLYAVGRSRVAAIRRFLASHRRSGWPVEHDADSAGRINLKLKQRQLRFLFVPVARDLRWKDGKPPPVANTMIAEAK